jgi:hypothetical protein
MKELDLHKFITDKCIEYFWSLNPDSGQLDVVFLVPLQDLCDLHKIRSEHDYDVHGGIPCRLKDGYIAFWASDILERNDINATDIFGEPDEE